MDFLRDAGSERVLGAFPDERGDLAALACSTSVVGSVEPLPAAFFPPIVFAIAFRPCWRLDTPGYPNPAYHPTRPPGKTKTNR